MFRLDNEIEMTVAVLQDVIEDTEYSLQDLKEIGFSYEFWRRLSGVTRRGETSHMKNLTNILKQTRRSFGQYGYLKTKRVRR